MKRGLCSAVFLTVLILDQLTKHFAVLHLSIDKPATVIPEFFDLTLVYNRGAAFGIFSGFPDVYRWVALGVVSCIALVVVFRYMFREAKQDPISQMALCGILAGAVGNIIDRFRYDAVVDFLDFYVGVYHWPAFNIADSAICLGVVILISRLVLRRDEQGEVS